MTKAEKRRARTRMADRVVIYARVSTEEQRQGGAGLDAQERECRAYAERNGLTVVAVVVEDAISGKVQPSSRPGFAQVLAMLDGMEAGSVLVRRFDRISRRVRHALAVVEDGDAAGWGVITCDGKIDTTTAAGRFQSNIVFSAAQYEADLIGERTREALAARKAAGVRLGAPVMISDEIVARIKDEHAAGRSMRAIAAGLTEDGVPTAKGGPWSHATVQSVLRRG